MSLHGHRPTQPWYKTKTWSKTSPCSHAILEVLSSWSELPYRDVMHQLVPFMSIPAFPSNSCCGHLLAFSFWTWVLLTRNMHFAPFWILSCMYILRTSMKTTFKGWEHPHKVFIIIIIHYHHHHHHHPSSLSVIRHRHMSSIIIIIRHPSSSLSVVVVIIVIII